jgi:hypothetical protein
VLSNISGCAAESQKVIESMQKYFHPFGLFLHLGVPSIFYVKHSISQAQKG